MYTAAVLGAISGRTTLRWSGSGTSARGVCPCASACPRHGGLCPAVPWVHPPAGLLREHGANTGVALAYRHACTSGSRCHQANA